MKELSIFVDESGNFGEYLPHDPFYVISLVAHDQEISIDDEVKQLNDNLDKLGLGGHCVHTGPMIRRQEDYRNMSVEERRKILDIMTRFIRKINVKYACVSIEKMHIEDSVEASGKLSKQISEFIRTHYDEFLSYDVVKVYYDNGQIEVTKILSSVFNALLNNVEFKKVRPSDYKLFQVADVICTFEQLQLKLGKRELSRSEKMFFGNMKHIKKNYLNVLLKKRWK